MALGSPTMTVDQYNQTDKAKQRQAAADAANQRRRQQQMGGGYGIGASGPGAYQPGAPMQAALGGGGAYMTGGGFAGYGAGAAGAGGAGGGGGGGGTVGVPELTLKSERSPDLDQATQQYNQQLQMLQQRANTQDQNLQWQINQYKSRLGEGPTTRAIERSASAVRDMMAGQMEDAQTVGAAGGRGQGYQAGAIGEAGQRAAAEAAANISLGREGQLDALTLGGQGIMAAPGARQQAYDFQAANMAQSPAAALAQARYGLDTQNLGLNAYQTQGQLALGQGQLAIQQAAAQRQMYGSPLDWFQTLYGGMA